MTRKPPDTCAAFPDLFGAADGSAGLAPATLGRAAGRLLDCRAAILEGPAGDIGYQHSVLCQTGLPYRPTTARVWQREQGAVALSIEAGRVRHPSRPVWIDLPLPHGEKPRLVLIHLNSEALKAGSPVIDAGDSMTAFVRSLGIDTNGRNLRTLKDQLARLAAATVRLAVSEAGRSVQINTRIVSAFDLWFPRDEHQRVLWPTTVRLSDEYFASLVRHAVPLDNRAVAALSGSALCLDIYAWLAQRLHRVPAGRPQTIPWAVLKEQFGVWYGRLDHFRTYFRAPLKAVLAVYPEARLDIGMAGLVLHHSPPPVLRRFVVGASLKPKGAGKPCG